jgi:hypothetical protein
MDRSRRDVAGVLLPVGGVLVSVAALVYFVTAGDPRDQEDLLSFYAFLLGLWLWSTGTIVRAIHRGFRDLSASIREKEATTPDPD